MFYLDVEGDVEKYIQVGIVQGSIGQCGDRNIPGIYVRLDDPEILQFLNSQRKGNLLGYNVKRNNVERNEIGLCRILNVHQNVWCLMLCLILVWCLKNMQRQNF